LTTRACHSPNLHQSPRPKMPVEDLRTAKKRLHERNLTLCITKDGETMFETGSHGISGFLDAIQKLQDRLEGASIADRVAGKAIALLCVFAKVKNVYALTMSKTAKKLLEKNSVNVEWENLVENIMDSSKTTTCPFEKLAAKISNPEKAYEQLKALQDSFEQCR
jgi:hypothetical protein